MPEQGGKEQTVKQARDVGKDLNKVILDFTKKMTAAINKGIKDLGKKIVATMKDAGKKAKDGFLKGIKGIKDGVNKIFKGLWKLIKWGALATAVGVVTTMFGMFKSFGGYIEKGITAFGTAGTVAAEEIVKMNKELRYIGKSFDDILPAAKVFMQSMGMGHQASVGLGMEMVKIGDIFAMSADATGKLMVGFHSLLGTSKETALNLMEGFGALIGKNNLSPAVVMNDMANSQELIAKYGKGMGGNIMNAAIFARKFGNELQTVEKTMNSLLNFETSIEKQMEASMLLGRQLNYQEAQSLALKGDMHGAMKSILNQVGGQAEWERMNVLQRQALADSIGVSVTEMAKFVRGGKEQADITEATATNLANAKDSLEKTKHSPMMKILGALKDVYDTIMLALAPAFRIIGDEIVVMAEQFKNWLGGSQGRMKNWSTWLLETWMKIKIFVWDNILGPDGVFGKFKELGFWGTMKEGMKGILGFIKDTFVATVDTLFGALFSKTGLKILAFVGLLFLLSWAFAKVNKTAIITLVGIAGSMYVMALAMEKMNALGANFYVMLGAIALGIYGLTLALGSLGASVKVAGIALLVLFGLAAAVWALGEALKILEPPLNKLLQTVFPVMLNYFELLFGSIVKIIDILATGLVSIIKTLGDVIVGVVDSVAQAFVALAEIWTNLVLGGLEAVNTMMKTVGDTIIGVINAVNNGIIGVMTIMSETVLGVMDRIIGIINAISGGIVKVINAIKDFQNVDYDAVSKTAWAYSKLAASLGSVAITAAAAGISQFIGSIGKLGSRALDSIGEALFGKEELQDINNYYNMSFDAGDAQLIGAAVVGALEATTLEVRVANTSDFSFGKQRG